MIEEPRITIRELSTNLNISVGKVHEMLKELGIRKLCSHFVPRFLMAEMMNKRFEACKQNLEILEQYGNSFLRNIITEDETPLSLYNPQSRRESKRWTLPGCSASLKIRSGTSHRKCLTLSLFWTSEGVLLSDFSESNITGSYYSDLLEKVRKCKRKSPGLALWLLHDNAPVHTSNAVKQKFTDLGFTQVEHPPYSPDLAPSDFHFFRCLKKHLRGNNFHSSGDLKQAVIDFIENCSPIFLKMALMS